MGSSQGIFWAAWLLLAATFNTVGFSSSQWLVLDDVVNPFTLDVVDRIECGMSTYCIHGGPSGNEVADFELGGPFCATRYGGTLRKIPSMKWRTATGVAIFSLLLLWVCFALSCATLCCCQSKIRRLRNVVPVSTAMSGIAIGFAADGFGDFKPPDNGDPKLCEMCAGAGSFEAGDCSIGFGFGMAVAGTTLALIASCVGYCVPIQNTVNNRVRPVEPDGQNWHQLDSSPDIAIHKSGLYSSIRR